eukprot:3933300-Pyramimonas_sp.AAC.1
MGDHAFCVATHAGLCDRRRREETKFQQHQQERTKRILLRLRSRATLGGPPLDPDQFGDPGSRPDALEAIADAEIDEHPGSARQRANNAPAEDTIKG